MKKTELFFLIILLGTLGILDAGYLSFEHYQNAIPNCTEGFFSDCGRVLRSSYSVVLGIPLAVVGAIHYASLTLSIVVGVMFKNQKSCIYLGIILSKLGIIASAYFVFLQLFVIKSICLYCMLSALNSLILFILVRKAFENESKFIMSGIIGKCYRTLVKPLLMKIDAETIHEYMVNFGGKLAEFPLMKYLMQIPFINSGETIRQNLTGIEFKLPVGLSAGFDYQAKLTQTLPSLGFGFETVGTITNSPYEGNAKPRLGRLPKSRSLLVNKGFKNEGADAIIKRLTGLDFDFPVGISIGRTNSTNLMTQEQSVLDIIEAFKKFEAAGLKHSYYELNISCPNLHGNISFYPPENLKALLEKVDQLKLSRPVFVKMPIELNDQDTMSLLKVISNYSPKGVIFGNLQKDRSNSELDPNEVAKFPVGNFSGKPTFQRSNELIKQAYANYKDRFIIIGCGGIFSAEDAYTKIKLGASLLQLITGMIYQGPQLISEINYGLQELLERDGFKNIQEAVGSGNTLILPD